MRGLFGFAGAIGLNYWCHKTGRPTACHDTRTHIPPALFGLAWGTLTGWLIRHIYGK